MQIGPAPPALEMAFTAFPKFGEIMKPIGLFALPFLALTSLMVPSRVRAQEDQFDRAILREGRTILKRWR